MDVIIKQKAKFRIHKTPSNGLIRHSQIYVRDTKFIYRVGERCMLESERKYVNLINYPGDTTKNGSDENEEQNNLMRPSSYFLVTHYSVTYHCLPGIYI